MEIVKALGLKIFNYSAARVISLTFAICFAVGISGPGLVSRIVQNARSGAVVITSIAFGITSEAQSIMLEAKKS